MEEESWFEEETQVGMGLDFLSRATGPAGVTVYTVKEQGATGSLSVNEV